MTKKLRITVDASVYEVEVEVLQEKTMVGQPGAVQPIKPAPKAPPRPAPVKPIPAGPGIIAAPLAGIIVKLTTSVGASVSQGDTVLMLEAMKMQTAIRASKSGVVKEIFVQPGNSVPEGTPLLHIE